MQRYNPLDIEPKWQQYWDENGTYVADLNSDKNKYYAMSMFNYPSGNLHIGHSMNFTISDVMARFKRQQGYETYHPVGWDSFGLPAENRAIKEGISPQESMRHLIPDYHKAYKAMGWSNDWSKEIATHTPEYYRWTQWIFAEMFKAGMAYQDSRLQWWCDIDKTVLSNEQVIDGKCWRHDGADDPLVEQREIKQWFFKITDYAEEMLDATDVLDWTESVKLAQKNWIGKSQGAEIDFELSFNDETLNDNRDENGNKAKLTVFTTRPDTIFGATFLVIAPEHKWVELSLEHGNVLANNDDVKKYLDTSARKSELERQANKDKTGVELKGVSAINPATGEKIPVWTADYVLSGYGTGVIMAVPAHDERDFEFAKKFGLTIKQVVAPETGIKRENEKFADGGASVVFDPKSQKYAFAKLDNGRTSLFAGGRNEGEDLHEGIIRELREESGLTKIDYYEEVAASYSHYYNSLKDINRVAKATALLVILNGTDTVDTALEEHEKFHLEWLDAADALKVWEQDESKSYDHYIYFLKQAVGRAIELGYDKTSDPSVFEHAVVIGEGIMIHSGEFDGKQTSDMREEIVDWLEQQGIGKSKTTFKIRDWSVGRQRYWGAPIPIIHCDKDGPVLVPDDQLPVVLPELDNFAPSGDGRSALARATDWLHVKCPVCGGDAERETDTLDTYIDSSWYFLRYLDPTNSEQAFGKDIANKWMQVDFYNGGDHATAHMIYARFITRFLHHQGLVNTPEPFKRFLFNGKVTASDGTMFSKSKGNGVDPLEIINSGYGADALRTYLMFAAPLDIWIKWDAQGVPATYRFLNRIWNLVQDFNTASEGEQSDAVLKLVHPAIHKVTSDLEDQKYNTAIAAQMKLVNDLYELKAKDNFGDRANWQFALNSLVALVAPFAPFISEELWHQLGHDTSVHRDSWPQWQDKYLVSDSMTIVVQINGKLRAQLELPLDTPDEDIKKAALEAENVVKFLDGKEPFKVIYVPKKLVNIVVK